VNWNIEWMNNWFVGGNEVALRDSYDPRGRPGDAIPDVDNLASRVAQVIRELAPDVLCIQEGPSDLREMELFVSTYLSGEDGQSLYQAFIAPDGRSQKAYVLIRTQAEVQNPRLASDARTQRLEEEWETDLEGVGILSPYKFTRCPLIVDCDWRGKTLRIVNLHLKSKFIHGGESMWNNPDRRPEFILEALKQRRRISAESMRVRRYLDDLLREDPLRLIIVTGDLNDGPGADYFEESYLTHNLTDILVGSTYHPAHQFQHTFLHAVPEVERYTAKFDDFITGEVQKSLVLDHILVSPVLRSGSLVSEGLLYGRVSHMAFERAIDPDAPTARQRFPSDHRPVLAVFGP
jgi:endonuclease/exonuclease/phosphatase family metal-dependent hydrolase